MDHWHFPLSAKARTLSTGEVFAMSVDHTFEAFREVRWGRDGAPECPACGVVEEHWFLPSRRQWRCRDCGHTFSVTSGTIFAHHRLPLQVYLGAAAIYTNAVKGLTALQMSRDLDVQYKTAFVIDAQAASEPHGAARRETVRGRGAAGEAEVKELLIGGVKPGKRGRGAEGSALVAVAVELLRPKGFGGCRLRVIPNTQAPTLRSFLRDYVNPGAVVVTDGLSSYPEAVGNDYVHVPHVVSRSGDPAHVALPGVHRVASLLKRWLLRTHQGAVEADNLQAYLDEFASRSTGPKRSSVASCSGGSLSRRFKSSLCRTKNSGWIQPLRSRRWRRSCGWKFAMPVFSQAVANRFRMFAIRSPARSASTQGDCGQYCVRCS